MAASPDTSRIAFVGLGNIGSPMAHALRGAGWNLTVHDRSAEATEPFAQAGVQVASSAAELAACDVLVLVVPDDRAVEELLEGTGGDPGWWDHEHGGSGRRVVVVHSTIMPATAARLAEGAAERGIAFLDAPVSGGAARAEAGDLTMMVGGTEEDIEAARPLLDALASTVLHVGAAGAGAATKLANQLMMLAALAGAEEALELAAAHGVDEATVLQAVGTSTGDSWVTRNWGFFDRTAHAYDRSGTPRSERPWSKDLFEVVAAARAVDVRVPVAGVLAQTLADRVEARAERAHVQEEAR